MCHNRAPLAGFEEMPKIKRTDVAGGEANSGGHVDLGPLTEYLGYALRRAQMSAVTEFLEAFAKLICAPRSLRC